MALHQLTPDELSRFENKQVEVKDKLQKMQMLVQNFKDKAGNDTAIIAEMEDIKTAMNDIATILGIAAPSAI